MEGDVGREPSVLSEAQAEEALRSAHVRWRNQSHAPTRVRDLITISVDRMVRILHDDQTDPESARKVHDAMRRAPSAGYRVLRRDVGAASTPGAHIGTLSPRQTNLIVEIIVSSTPSDAHDAYF